MKIFIFQILERPKTLLKTSVFLLIDFDDIISKSLSKIEVTFRKLFEIWEANNFLVDLKKCPFLGLLATSSGFVISSKGVIEIYLETAADDNKEWWGAT